MNGPLTLPLERVMVPTDLSETSGRATDAAVDWATTFARHSVASVTLAHVMNPFAQFEQAPWTEQEREADLRSAAREALEHTEARVRLDVAVLQGEHPAERLIEHANELKSGMIVMGTHGDGILLRAILGSVSSKMVRQSPIPVLLVPRASEGYDSAGEAKGKWAWSAPQPVAT